MDNKGESTRPQRRARERQRRQANKILCPRCEDNLMYPTSQSCADCARRARGHNEKGQFA